MTRKLKNALGTWKITFGKNTKPSLIVVKNQAQAKFLTDNMYVLNIDTWEAKEARTGENYKGGITK